MAGFGNMFDQLAGKAEQAAVKNEKDYVIDGFIHCGDCGTRKQCLVKHPVTDNDMKVFCICKCEDEKIKQEEAHQAARRRNEFVERSRSIGLNGSMIRDWTFAADNNADRENAGFLQRYCENFGDMKSGSVNLILHGKPGSGKTFYAACVANELLRKGRSVLMTNFPKVIRKYQDSKEKSAYIDDLNRYELLIIDDLGVERGSEFAQEIVFSVVDARYQDGKPILITTNLDPDSMKNEKEPMMIRTYRRILENSHPMLVERNSTR